MKKLLWLDMEMTGLDVETEVIIEVAAIVTDLNFKELDSFETVVKQPSHYLEHMDDWNREHHTKSGLLKKIPQGMDPEFTEVKLIDLIKKHWPDPKDKPILAGNSIAQDRLFIDRYFLQLSKLLHYRLMDVSSWKIIFANMYGFTYSKTNQHRALDDIRESIQEMQAYLQYINLPKK